MPTQLLTERFAFSGGTVDTTDPERPIIRDVLLCGPVSANKRRYLKSAFEGDRVKRYNDKPVFIDHSGRPGESRSYRVKVGLVENARHRADGMPIGDLAVNPHAEHARAFLWDAANKPQSCGMSHVANCEFTPGRDGFVDVTELVAVESVDVVIGPAHGGGIFEQRGRTVSHTIKTLTEWVTKHPKSTTKQILTAKRLLEFDMGMADAPVMDAPADDAEPEDGVSAAIKAAATKEIDDCMAAMSDPATVKKCLQRLKKILGLHGDLSGDAGAEEEAEAEPEAPAEEQARRAAAELPYTIIAECQAKNYTPGAATLRALAAMTAPDRVAFITEQTAKPGANAERIASASRRPGAGTAGTPASVQTPVQEQRLIPAWN